MKGKDTVYLYNEQIQFQMNALQGSIEQILYKIKHKNYADFTPFDQQNYEIAIQILEIGIKRLEKNQTFENNILEIETNIEHLDIYGLSSFEIMDILNAAFEYKLTLDVFQDIISNMKAYVAGNDSDISLIIGYFERLIEALRGRDKSLQMDLENREK